ncbi:methyltransferase [Streptomyces sp. SL13]|uniref:Methyltransferase n=1 Tax=Streptantibioticus silvisoli TaxID=2705255 RepID=A0AA90H7Y2_9ACTN|nr:methyltransferase [Streptantibioticus silvisoli]MDI5967336.1 methyltransferase [Streptantibioticus silvisoli]MDI5972655.1 methyltransferase [Streptantibioticus silvisoli]
MGTDAAAPYTPTITIGRLNTAYAQSKILHAAVETGLFELLDEAPADLTTIATRLELHPRLLPDFLRALVALGLVDDTASGYRNSAQTSACLLPGSPYYLGASVRTAAARHYAMWGRLTEALKDGQAKADNGAGPGAFERLYRNPEAARRFLAHMDSAHALVGPQLAEVVDWSRYHSFVDVGGARGHIAAAVLTAHPHLTGGVFELPAVEPLFDEHMAQAGLSDRVTFHAGDFFADPLPTADVLVFGHVLHDWEPDARQTLLDKAFQALAPGGAVVVYDQMLDDTEPELAAILGSLQVALVTGGSEYPVTDCRQWLEKAGFTIEQGERIRTIGSDYVLVAVKP